MEKNNEISSTERLLSLIRGKKKKQLKLKSPTIATTSKPSKRSKTAVGKVLFLKKTVTVGVDIGYDDLKLIKIRQFSNKKQELLDYLLVPFEPGISREHPNFPDFLRSALTRFSGTSKKLRIWGSISSARVELRYLQIPRVPKKQIANAVFWTFKKEVPFNEKEMLFDFEVLGDTGKEGLPKLEVVAYTIPHKEIQDLQDIFSKSGLSLSGVSIVPFAFQNLLRSELISSVPKNVCSLFIGRDWSRIDIFSNHNLVLSRGIKAGLNSMLETIREEIDATLDQATLGITENEEEAQSDVLEEETAAVDTDLTRKLFYGIEDDSFLNDKEVAALGLKADEIFFMIQPALERLVRQVERTLGHFSLNFANQVVEKIFISGGIISHRRIVEYIGDQLGLARETIDPFQLLPATSKKILIPQAPAERSSFAPAVGLALSNNLLTPNFIFTYKDKDSQQSIRRINRMVLRGFLFMLVICIGVYFWMENRVSQKKAYVDQLNQQLEQFTPRINQELILQVSAQIQKKNRMLASYSQKYLSLAAISEITHLTPANIRIIRMDISMEGKQTQPKAEDQKKAEGPGKKLVLDGIVLGDHLSFETDLASYLLKLKQSPLFQQPNVREKKVEYFNNKAVLRFNTELKII